MSSIADAAARQAVKDDFVRALRQPRGIGAQKRTRRYYSSADHTKLAKGLRSRPVKKSLKAHGLRLTPKKQVLSMRTGQPASKNRLERAMKPTSRSFLTFGTKNSTPKSMICTAPGKQAYIENGAYSCGNKRAKRAAGSQSAAQKKVTDNLRFVSGKLKGTMSPRDIMKVAGASYQLQKADSSLSKQAALDRVMRPRAAPKAAGRPKAAKRRPRRNPGFRRF